MRKGPAAGSVCLDLPPPHDATSPAYHTSETPQSQPISQAPLPASPVSGRYQGHGGYHPPGAGRAAEDPQPDPGRHRPHQGAHRAAHEAALHQGARGAERPEQALRLRDNGAGPAVPVQLGLTAAVLHPSGLEPWGRRLAAAWFNPHRVWGLSLPLNTTMVNCPANGCSSAVLWSIYGPYEILMWSGVALFVSGVG